jgi:hypothetical protein
MIRHYVFTIVFMLAAPSAHAALQCEYYDDLVDAAAMVMQIGETEVTAPEAVGGTCRVTGTILRSFQGPHPVGTRIETQVPCHGYPITTDEEIPIEVGPTIFWQFDALTDAAVIELHIAAEGGPAGYGSGVYLLDIPTDTPARLSACGT